MTEFYNAWINIVGEYEPIIEEGKIIYDLTPIYYGAIAILLAWIVYIIGGIILRRN